MMQVHQRRKRYRERAPPVPVTEPNKDQSSDGVTNNQDEVNEVHVYSMIAVLSVYITCHTIVTTLVMLTCDSTSIIMITLFP